MSKIVFQLYNAGYTAEVVACCWAGAKWKNNPEKAEKANARPTNGSKLQPTDKRTNLMTYSRMQATEKCERKSEGRSDGGKSLPDTKV